MSVDPHLVAVLGTLCDAGAPAWAVHVRLDGVPYRGWEARLLAEVHEEALWEDRARRRWAPRTAREYSERDWWLARRRPALSEELVAAYAAHKATAPAPRRSSPGRRRSLATYYAQALQPLTDGAS